MELDSKDNFARSFFRFSEYNNESIISGQRNSIRAKDRDRDFMSKGKSHSEIDELNSPRDGTIDEETSPKKLLTYNSSYGNF